jgi:hypothetical protein
MKEDHPKKEFYQLNRYKMLILFLNTKFGSELITAFFVLFELLQILGIFLDPDSSMLRDNPVWVYFATALKYCGLSPRFALTSDASIESFSIILPLLFIIVYVGVRFVEYKAQTQEIEPNKRYLPIIFACKTILTINCVAVIPLFQQVFNTFLCALADFSTYKSCFSSILKRHLGFDCYSQCYRCALFFYFTHELREKYDQHECFWKLSNAQSKQQRANLQSIDEYLMHVFEFLSSVRNHFLYTFALHIIYLSHTPQGIR